MFLPGGSYLNELNGVHDFGDPQRMLYKFLRVIENKKSPARYPFWLWKAKFVFILLTEALQSWRIQYSLIMLYVCVFRCDINQRKNNTYRLGNNDLISKQSTNRQVVKILTVFSILHMRKGAALSLLLLSVPIRVSFVCNHLWLSISLQFNQFFSLSSAVFEYYRPVLEESLSLFIFRYMPLNRFLQTSSPAC